MVKGQDEIVSSNHEIYSKRKAIMFMLIFVTRDCLRRKILMGTIWTVLEAIMIVITTTANKQYDKLTHEDRSGCQSTIFPIDFI